MDTIVPDVQYSIPLHLQLPLQHLITKYPSLNLHILHTFYRKGKGFLLIMGQKYCSEFRAEVYFTETKEEAKGLIGTGRLLFSVCLLSYEEVFGLYPRVTIAAHQPATIYRPTVR